MEPDWVEIAVVQYHRECQLIQQDWLSDANYTQQCSCSTILDYRSDLQRTMLMIHLVEFECFVVVVVVGVVAVVQ